MRPFLLATLGVGSLCVGALFADEPQKPFAPPKPAQTEVDAVTISAVAWRRAAPAGLARSGPHVVEIVVRPKDPAKPLTANFQGAVELLDEDGDPIRERGNGMRWHPKLEGGIDPSTKAQKFLLHTNFFPNVDGKGVVFDRTIPGISGAVTVAEAATTRYEFTGANCKPNGVAKSGGEEARLSMFDFEDGYANVNVRFASNPAEASTSMDAKSDLIMTFPGGKKRTLSSNGYSSGGGTHSSYARTIRFTGPVETDGEPIAVVFEQTRGKGAGRAVKFVLKDVPIREGEPQRNR